MAEADYVFAGTGINALVCAALLSKRRKKVLLLEREEEIGGCIRTDEIIAAGFTHDLLATTFVLFVTSPGYKALAKDLEKRGLEFCNSPTPAGVLLPDGRAMVVSTNRAENIRNFDLVGAGDGHQHEADMKSVEGDASLLFGLLGRDLWTKSMAGTLAWRGWKRGTRELATFFGESLVSARAWLEASYTSDVIQALWAPWVLHAGLSPDSAYSGQMGKVMAFTLESAGAPIVKGGAKNLLKAFRSLIEVNGGIIRTKADVEAIVLDEKGAAKAVRLADGEQIDARRSVICSMTPQQLYGRLLKGTAIPEHVSRAVALYRHGRGNMQIHYALRRPPKWTTPGLEQVALLHLTPGLDGVSRAANEADRGILPEFPTICVGQPTALDPSRAPDGQAVLWIQLPETPRTIKGDSAKSIWAPPDGRWTEAICEAYANRVEAILSSHIEDFEASVIGRVAYSPADLEAMNVNLVGGDPYGGYCGLDQSFIWRPFKTSVNHETHVPKLYHIGASTHPGPGLGGGSGYLLGRKLK